jgi:hypothetical protein
MAMGYPVSKNKAMVMVIAKAAGQVCSIGTKNGSSVKIILFCYSTTKYIYID